MLINSKNKQFTQKNKHNLSTKTLIKDINNVIFEQNQNIIKRCIIPSKQKKNLMKYLFNHKTKILIQNNK